PVDTTWGDDPDRWFLIFHHVDLHSTGLRPEDVGRVVFDVVGVGHIPGRMVFRRIERSEIVPFILYFPVFCDGKSYPRENVDDLVHDEADRVTTSQLHWISGPAEIQFLNGGLLAGMGQIQLTGLVFFFSE